MNILTLVLRVAVSTCYIGDVGGVAALAYADLDAVIDECSCIVDDRNIPIIGTTRSRKIGTLDVVATIVSGFLSEMSLRTWNMHPCHHGRME